MQGISLRMARPEDAAAMTVMQRASWLAAYGGVFIIGSLIWGMVFDDFRPDRYDLIGAAICLVGVATIMYAPRT